MVWYGSGFAKIPAGVIFGGQMADMASDKHSEPREAK